MMCGKCRKGSGWTVLIVGILLLLQNLGVWNIWGIQWYTFAFVLWGLFAIGSSCCSHCNSCSAPAPAKKGKK